MGKDPLDTVKRNVYLAALAFGLPAILLLWVTFDSVVHVVFPLFALFCLGGAWAIWSRAVPIRLVERAMFAGASGFALTQLAYALYASDDLADARTAITEIPYAALTIIYVTAHLIFDSRTAFGVSLALYAAGLAIVFVRILPEVPGGLSVEEISWLVRMHAFMGAVIVLTYASSYAKNLLSQQRAVAETMRQLAHTDQLTGIANRRQLYSELQKETEEANRYGRPLSVILFDLDEFKHVNDAYGHDCGDNVLREVVRAIEPLLRGTDRLGRWGGEEFILLAPETDLRQSSRLAERLREGIADYNSDSTPGVTASFGFAQHETGEGPEALLKRADEALYKAKALGRNRVEPTP